MSSADPTKRTIGIDEEGFILLCCDCPSPSDGPETCGECACLYSDGTKTALVNSINGDLSIKIPWTGATGIGGWNCGSIPEPGIPGLTYQDATVPANELKDAINHVISQDALRSELLNQAGDCKGVVWTVPWGEKDITDPTWNGENSIDHTVEVYGIALCQDFSTYNDFTTPAPIGSNCWFQASGFGSIDYRSLLEDQSDSFMNSSVVEIPTCVTLPDGSKSLAYFMGGIGVSSVSIQCGSNSGDNTGSKIHMLVRFSTYGCGAANIDSTGRSSGGAYLTQGHVESLPNYEQYMVRIHGAEPVLFQNADNTLPYPWVGSNCDSIPDLTDVSVGGAGDPGGAVITTLPLSSIVTM